MGALHLLAGTYVASDLGVKEAGKMQLRAEGSDDVPARE